MNKIHYQYKRRKYLICTPAIIGVQFSGRLWFRALRILFLIIFLLIALILDLSIIIIVLTFKALYHLVLWIKDLLSKSIINLLKPFFKVIGIGIALILVIALIFAIFTDNSLINTLIAIWQSIK